MSEVEQGINVYDFDNTIYDGDSTIDFFRFCLRNKTLIAFCMIKPLCFAALFAFGLISRERFKTSFYKGFLPHIENISQSIAQFWEHGKTKIKPWYLSQKKTSDLIVSASPEFLLSPICGQLGVQLIASAVDDTTGELLGRNCRGEEKVRRIHEHFGSIEIDSFYSDSKSDAPLAVLAKKSFMVKGDCITESDFFDKDTPLKKGRKIFQSEQVRFTLIGGMNTVIDFIILNILVRFLGFDYIPANIISTTVALMLGFILNRKYTFKSKSKHYLREMVLFFLFAIIGLWGLQNLAIIGVLTVMPDSISDSIALNIAKAIGALVSLVWNYSTSKHIVFRKEK